MLLGSWEWPRGQCAEPEGEAREGRQWQAGSLLVWLELLAFPFQAPEESSVTHLLHCGNNSPGPMGTHAWQAPPATHGT